MTTRQQEFVRHYLAGHTAPDAAVAAGYARSTAEKNAAAMLRHPEVAVVLARMRGYRDAQARTLMEVCLDNLTHTVKYVSDDRLKNMASREIRAWLKAGRDLLPPVSAFCGDFMGESTNTNENDSQSADSQQADPQNQFSTNPPIEECDHLEDGTPAFDVRQAPRKPAPPKKQPVEIILVDRLTPQTEPGSSTIYPPDMPDPPYR